MDNHVTTDVLSTVRQADPESRDIEGIAVPYGVVARDTEIGPEAFAPGAFRESVEQWTNRSDGARLAFRPAHREKPIGVVTALADTPDGVRFRAAIFDGPAGDEYLSQVGAGLNGVSVEAGLERSSRRTKDGVTLHRSARLYAIAGSVSPAYDGARISLRDMEDAMSDTETTPTETTETLAERSAAERADATAAAVVREATRAPILVTREASIYGREAASGPRGERYGFLSDGWLAKEGNSDARERQYRFEMATNEIARKIERDALTAYRAGDVVASEIPGAYPNDYIPGLLTPRILKGRPMGSFFNRFPISDALPKIFPKVTTSTTVAVQSAELSNPAASDFATTAVSVTPALYGAETVVSRQVLDGSNPGAEAMVLQDMIEAYAQASETVIKTAVESGASASGQAITAATPFAGLVANIVAYTSARFLPAEGVFIPSALWATAIKQPDTSSLRPLLSNIGPTNAVGVITGGTLGATLLGADLFHSYASTTNVVVTARPDDYVIYESAIARFSYDAVTGPAGVRIGLWAYLAIGTRKGGLSVTAA